MNLSHVFTIRLAEIPILVFPQFQHTKQFCLDYHTKEAPLHAMALSSDDIQYERETSDETYAAEGLTPTSFSDSYLETLALARKSALLLTQHDTVLFHGSAVAVEDAVYLFTAPSGTGKTTHSRLWLKTIPGSFILNGDKPLISCRENRVVVHGSPWKGKENYGVNRSLPLKAVCILERGETNEIHRIPAREAFPTLLTQVNRPKEPEAMRKTLQVLKGMMELPIYRLHCNMEDEAALVSCRGMQ